MATKTAASAEELIPLTVPGNRATAACNCLLALIEAMAYADDGVGLKNFSKAIVDPIAILARWACISEDDLMSMVIAQPALVLAALEGDI